MRRSRFTEEQIIGVLREQEEVAAAEINIDKAATRTLIDAHLRARDWDADTPTLRYSTGVRPTKGRNFAITEWPTKSGPADYALFVGTRCIAVVEAKRQNKNVSGFIDQAQRYSRGFRFEGGAEAIGAMGRDGRKHLPGAVRLFCRWPSLSEAGSFAQTSLT